MIFICYFFQPNEKMGGRIHVRDVYKAEPDIDPCVETVSRLANADCLDLRESKCPGSPVEAAKNATLLTLSPDLLESRLAQLSQSE